MMIQCLLWLDQVQTLHLEQLYRVPETDRMKYKPPLELLEGTDVIYTLDLKNPLQLQWLSTDQNHLWSQHEVLLLLEPELGQPYILQTDWAL